VADVLPEALSRQEAAARRAGISVGQYSAAMRTLPAQFTDIATQLAGGQSPFLILLQQGGQIKDQFGGVQGALTGVGEYIRSMAGMINPTTIALAGLVGTIGLLAAAAYSSSQQFDQVARSVIMMGGAGFASMQQLNQAAEEVAGKTNTSISSTVDTLVTLNDTGKYTASQMKQIATSITLMGKAGSDTKAAMSDFGKLVSDPVKGLASLNEQYGFVDEAMMKHIIQLRKQKGEQAAVTEAIQLYADVMAERANKTIEATDNIGKAWGSLKAFASDTFGQIGVTVRAWGNQVIEVFKLLGTSFEALFVKIKEFSLEIMGGMITGFTDIANKLPGGEALIKTMGFDGLAESVATQRNAANKEYAQLTADYNRHFANLSKSQAQWEEEAKNGSGGGVKGSGAVSRETKDAVTKLAEDSAKKTKEARATLDAGDRTLENYRAQARTLTETLETLRQTGDIHAKNTEFSKQQSHFAELDEAAKTRALTAQEKSLLSSREAILNAAKVVDQKNKEVEAQQKINGLAQQANKYVTQMAEKTDALRDSAGLSSRQTQRLMEEAQLRQGWLNGGGKLEDAGYEKELAALKNYYAEEDKLRGDWKAGALSGWNEYLDAATNTYDAIKNVASSTLTGLSDMLTELMTTGKASVKEFGKSMLKMILDVTNRLMVAYAVQAAMGWISGGSGASAGAGQSLAVPSFTPNAKGGVYESPGLSKYVNGVYDTPQYFAFQGASKFAKGGVFAEAGAEAIMPLTRDSAGRLGVRAQGGGGAQPQVNIDIYVDNKGNATSNTSGDGSAAARALGKEIESKVTEILARAARSDGLLGRQFQSK